MSFERAVILSAGKGSRLLPLTEDRPKCLIDFSGRTLLEWQLDALRAGGVRDITVVTGFRSDLVDAVIAARGDPGVRTLFNPFYHVAENVGSVWMARERMQDDFLILNGDTLIAPEIVARVVQSDAPITVTIDEKPDYDEDDMKVVRSGDRLVRIGKVLDDDIPDAESIGFLAFRGDGARQFVASVDAILHDPVGVTSWYLKVIDRIAPSGTVSTRSIKGLEWAEVDYPADLDIARALTDKWAAAGR
ncbi:MAG TPA: phosphocholine cytidylyltransferase family protein [Sphingomonas sp.]|jgi:choline kinase|uniref:phosphocholine cytidylyltransferase family protein n=1 Tax=Sphingomonas sp. TaxID=28214 RepID=UPI002ED87A85